MSALWSLTYLKTSAPIADVFKTLVAVFLREIDNKLYDIEDQNGVYVDVKTGRAIIEEFSDPVRARLIVDSCQLEWYNRGVILYPQKNGLISLTDTINHLGNVYDSGRSRRTELAERLSHETDHFSESLFLFINFMAGLTKELEAEAVHILFERNPATRATGVHFFQNGKLIDDYYHEDLEDIGERGLIELPENPDQVQAILDGRFSLLVGLPKIRLYGDGESEDTYFDGEDLSGRLSADHDVLNIRASQLYVPFWDELSAPFGAVYCPKRTLPEDFLNRYLNHPLL